MNFKEMNILKPLGSPGFAIGLGIAALTYFLGPSLKRGARNVAVKGMQGALMAGEGASNAMHEGKETMSNMFGNTFGNENYMNEMSTEMAQQNTQMVQQVFQEMREEREQYKNMFQEMMNTMQGMQDDISSLKANQKRNKMSQDNNTKSQ